MEVDFEKRDFGKQSPPKSPSPPEDGMRLKEADEIADGLVMALQSVCERVKVAGSVRRGKAVVKDIEIVCVPRIETVTVSDLFGGEMCERRSLLDERLNDMVRSRTLVRGDKDGERMKTFGVSSLDGNIQLDLFIVLPPAQWGVIYTIRTGPAGFSQWLVTPRSKGGALPDYMRVSGGALRDMRGAETIIPTPEEKDFFAALGLNWKEPSKRETKWRG